MTPGQASPPGKMTHPVLGLAIAAVWLLLNQSLEPAALLTAALLGLLVPRLLRRLLRPAARPARWGTMLKLTALVLWDIVLSNITVARIVLNPAARPRPAWIPVKLDTRHPTAITLLAAIITTTPGTVSCVVDEQRGEILVHALDCDDVSAAAVQIKQRYEQPLMEIFG